MGQLAELLKEFYSQSNFKSVAELFAQAKRYQSFSKSYLMAIMSGQRQNPSYEIVMALAKALALNPAETNRLLEAAGLPALPQPAVDLKRAANALERLATTPGIPAEAVELIIQGLEQIVAGVQATLEKASPAPALPPVFTAPLTPEEELIDELLGDILSQPTAHPLETLFTRLRAQAQGEQWETRRRIAEALPKLVLMQPDDTLTLADLLRSDYHPDYRADIRRRVVEAVPALYAQRPQAALALLEYRERDEVYTAMATLEVLYDLQAAGQMSREVARPYIAALFAKEREQLQVIEYHQQLLSQVEASASTALTTMQADRAHPERIYKISILRVVPRLLFARPQPVLDLFFYYLRRGPDGSPAEHQNLRRPISRVLPDILALMQARFELTANISMLIHSLAADPDIHVRRAVSDVLDRLVVINKDLGIAVLDRFIQDADEHVRHRAWRLVMRLADVYPEQVSTFYARLLSPGTKGEAQ